jgi:hypothetical protein
VLEIKEAFGYNWLSVCAPITCDGQDGKGMKWMRGGGQGCRGCCQCVYSERKGYITDGW